MKDHGFTLIEMLIAIMLGFILCLAAGGALQSLTRSWQKLSEKITPIEVAVGLAGVICREINYAASVSIEAGGTCLYLVSVDGDLIQYALVEGMVRRKVNASNSYLTYAEKISGLRFGILERGMVYFELEFAGGTEHEFFARPRI